MDGNPREALVVTPLSPRKRSFHERNDGLGTLVCESCTEISAGVGIQLDHEPTKLQRPLSLHSARCAALLDEPARDPSPRQACYPNSIILTHHLYDTYPANRMRTARLIVLLIYPSPGAQLPRRPWRTRRRR